MPRSVEQRRTEGNLPAIFSFRTTGPLVISGLLGVALLAATKTRAPGLALLAWSTVLLAQHGGPLLREWSKKAVGRWRAILFNLPFALFFLPALIWTLVTRPQPVWAGPGIIVGVAFGLAMQATDWKQWRLGFDRDLLDLLPPVGPVLLAVQTWMLVASAVFQEAFYRGVLFVILSGWPTAVIIAASTLAFLLEHTSNRWATRAHGWRYYLRLTALSVGLGILASEASLSAAVAGHLAFNAVPLAQLVLRWRGQTARAGGQTSVAASR